MMQTSTKFRKYDESGAYHWRATYEGGWRRSSPTMHARYDILLHQLTRRLDLHGALGLDVGCGDGVMLYKISEIGGSAVGVDLEHDGLVAGRDMLSRRGLASVPLVCASGYRLPFADKSFDYVVAAEVIEHLDDPQIWLAEVRRVLRPEGVLALSTPHRLDSGEFHDPYHCREYDGPALHRELDPLFGEVTILGQYPRLLHNLYHRGTGIRALDLSLRFGVKLLAAVGLNLFTLWITPDPTGRCDGLVAVARSSVTPQPEQR